MDGVALNSWPHISRAVLLEESKNRRHPRRAFKGSTQTGDGNIWNSCSPSGQAGKQRDCWLRELLVDSALTPWPFLQVGHQHRATPVCPAVPADLHAAAQCQRVWAGRTRAPAAPPQHDLEDLAHLYPGCHPHWGEVPSLLPMAHSKQCPLFLPESNLQSRRSSNVTYEVTLIFCPISVDLFVLKNICSKGL